MSADRRRVAAKIVKKLKAADDNDKIAALAHLIKLFESPDALAASEDGPDMWASLRSTHFLERALRGDETKGLALTVLSVFSRVVDPTDLAIFFPILWQGAVSGDIQARDTFAEIVSCLKDAAVAFDVISVSNESLPAIVHFCRAMKAATATPAVYKVRAGLFALLTGHEDLSVRRDLFLAISGLIKANNILAVSKAHNVIDSSQFLVAERLALVELRLQLDIPTDYVEMEDKTAAFTQKIGKLVNPELSAASCEMLEVLMLPLLSHEEEMTDGDIDHYFDTVNSIVKDAVAIFAAAKGSRDKERIEMKCLLSIFAMWLRDAPFLCGNVDFLNEIHHIVPLLSFFAREALQFVPVFMELASSTDTKRKLRTAGIIDLCRVITHMATPEEILTLNDLTKACT